MNKLIPLFLFFSIYFSAQKIVSGDFSFPAEEYNAEVLDQSLQNFYYQLKYLPNKEKPSNFVEAVYVLEVGKNYSKFTEVNNLKLDSLAQKFSLLSSVGAKEINETINFKTRSKLVLIKNREELISIFQNSIAGKYYQFQEKQPILNWT